MSLKLLIACAALALPISSQSKHVAIYKDVGVWSAEGDRAIPAALEWLGHSWSPQLRSVSRPAFASATA